LILLISFDFTIDLEVELALELLAGQISNELIEELGCFNFVKSVFLVD